MESGGFKLALLLGTNWYFLNSISFHKVVLNNEGAVLKQ